MHGDGAGTHGQLAGLAVEVELRQHGEGVLGLSVEGEQVVADGARLAEVADGAVPAGEGGRQAVAQRVRELVLVGARVQRLHSGSCADRAGRGLLRATDRQTDRQTQRGR